MVSSDVTAAGMITMGVRDSFLGKVGDLACGTLLERAKENVKIKKTAMERIHLVTAVVFHAPMRERVPPPPPPPPPTTTFAALLLPFPRRKNSRQECLKKSSDLLSLI